MARLMTSYATIFKHTCEIAAPRFHALLQELTQRIVSAANNVFKYGRPTETRTQNLQGKSLMRYHYAMDLDSALAARRSCLLLLRWLPAFRAIAKATNGLRGFLSSILSFISVS